MIFSFNKKILFKNRSEKFLSVFLTGILVFILSFQGYPTHNRAGEITYKQISQLTFQITVITFTNTKPTSTGQIPADRPQLEVSWGDNTSTTVNRNRIEELPDYYRKNTYISNHTFPGAGTYEIMVEDPNRNEGVQNIPNSVNVVFSIRTIMQINPQLGYNNTPVLLNPPVDKAAKGRIFIHNPAAFDPDGDSISYKLTPCSGENGQPIPGYSLPAASHRPVFINERTGDLIWDSPINIGIYNVAILIEEWRQGIKIGEIVRDMQIEVYEASNRPPVINNLIAHCITAKDTLQFNVIATDPNNDLITLSAAGGPFIVNNPAVFNTITGHSPVQSTFTWKTDCSHVRIQPYMVVFKAEDNNDELNLVDLKNVNISVHGPAPENLTLTPTNNSVALNWSPSVCTEIKGYRIYRTSIPTGYIHDSCVTGVPGNIGYGLVKELNNPNVVHFIDNNDGTGLLQGYQYCYMMTAFYADGAESYPTPETCTELVRGVPVLVNVDVLKTDSLRGKLRLVWVKPVVIDSVATPPPFSYKISRSVGYWGANMTYVATINNFSDTVFVDSMINTYKNPYSYKVEFYASNGLVDLPMIASSVFLETKGEDNRVLLTSRYNVPWQNQAFIYYHYNLLTHTYDSIGWSETNQYMDNNLNNGDSLFYKCLTKGQYDLDVYPKPLLNFSQENFAIPTDTVPPSNPVVKVTSDCDSIYNIIRWEMVPEDPEIVQFLIYYTPSLSQDLSLLATVSAGQPYLFKHFPQASMSGCYAVTAVDSAGNESPIDGTTCVDVCKYYELPNVFTPNGDEFNPLFIPVTPPAMIEKFVEKVNIKIYSRWGNLVFETDDKYIKWDGHNKQTGKMVADGVYFYVCDVYERRLSGSEPRYLTGFIYVFSSGSK